MARYFIQSMGDVNWYAEDLLEGNGATLLFTHTPKGAEPYLLHLEMEADSVMQYRVDVPQLSLAEAKEEWWWDKLGSIATAYGKEPDKLVDMLQSSDPVRRALVWVWIGDYYGWLNHDGSPDVFDSRGEVRRKFRRWI